MAGRNGFTLIEVLAGMMLLAILWLGMMGFLHALEVERLNRVWKQQAVLALEGHMQRLADLYNRGDLWLERATHADDAITGEGRWLYRARPAGITCPVQGVACFLLTYSLPRQADFATFGPDQVVHLSQSPGSNIVWLDREARVTGKLAWNVAQEGLNACCRKVVLSLTWPFRFVEGEDPAQDSLGSTQTITLEAVLGVQKPTLVTCPRPPSTMVARTGQTTSYIANDDGMLRAGVAWPDTRFTDLGNGSVQDNLTGLRWLKNADCFGEQSWPDAITAANNLASGACGLTDGSVAGDWRMPNIKELVSMIDYGISSIPVSHPFSNVPYYMWAGTSYVGGGAAYYMAGYGGTNGVPKTVRDPSIFNVFPSVWPVHVLAANAPSPVLRTGQTIQYASGDDGHLQKGVAWPIPRFTDNGDGTITDNLTNLVWMKNANCWGSQTWENAFSKVASLNAGMENCTGYTTGTHTDWRLPNVRELYSLTDFSRTNPALPAAHPFINVQYATSFWTSNQFFGNTAAGWYVWFIVGTSSGALKVNQLNLWPVRGGE